MAKQAKQTKQAGKRTASGMVAEGGTCESDAVCAAGTYCTSNGCDDCPPDCAGKCAGADDGCGVPSSFYTPERDARSRAALQATLGMVAFVDDRVGAMLAALEETGQADRTVVLFTTDHGEMHGHHGFWGKGLTAYDDCQRVPLLAWGPGRVAARGTVDALANLVDLPRTVLGLCGVDEPLGIEGVDLGPVLDGSAEGVRDWTLVECQATERIYQQTFITDGYKLVLYRDSDDAELYDMREDPDQYVNLWRRPGDEALKRELLHRVARANMQREGRVTPRRSFA